jgi:hypothetical protein
MAELLAHVPCPEVDAFAVQRMPTVVAPLEVASIDVVVDTSIEYNANALSTAAKSEMRVESLAWRKSSAGFRVKTTTTAKMAMIAMTTRSSMRVKPFCFLFFFILILI